MGSFIFEFSRAPKIGKLTFFSFIFLLLISFSGGSIFFFPSLEFWFPFILQGHVILVLITCNPFAFVTNISLSLIDAS